MPSNLSNRVIALNHIKDAFRLSPHEFFDVAVSLSAEAAEVLNPTQASKECCIPETIPKQEPPIDKNTAVVASEVTSKSEAAAKASNGIILKAFADQVGLLSVNLEEANIYLWHLGKPMVKSTDGFTLDEYLDFLKGYTQLPPCGDKPYTTYGKLREAFELYQGEVTNMVMDLSSIPRKIVHHFWERDISQLRALIDDTTVGLDNAFYYLWGLRLSMRHEVDGLSFDGYHRSLESQSLDPISNPQARPCIDPSAPGDLINIELLERAFKSGTYSLKNTLLEMAGVAGGAYTHDGDFVFCDDMNKEKEDFCDMVYRHCREVEAAKNSDDQAAFNPYDRPDTPESLKYRDYMEIIDRTNIPAQITPRTYDLALATERLYWELRSAKKEVLEILGEVRDADVAAAKEIETEVFDPGRNISDINQRLLIYAEKFRLALLDMSDWYGLYRYSFKKDWACSELMQRGYRPLQDVPGLSVAQAGSVSQIANPGLGLIQQIAMPDGVDAATANGAFPLSVRDERVNGQRSGYINGLLPNTDLSIRAEWKQNIANQVSALSADAKLKLDISTTTGKQYQGLLNWLDGESICNAYAKANTNVKPNGSGGKQALHSIYDKLAAMGVIMPFEKGIITGATQH